MANCGRLVLRYLAGTKNLGIGYSPSEEREFIEVNKTMMSHPDNSKCDPKQLETPLQVYSDASFGVVYATMRSIGGVVCYLKGCPVSWGSPPQTIFCGSTMYLQLKSWKP